MGQARRRLTAEDKERKKARALELSAMGRNYKQIADDLGYKSHNSARSLILSALEEHTKANFEAVQAVRAKELLQMESIESSLLPMVVGQDLSVMTDKERYTAYEAVDRIVKIKERRAKMLGLDHTTDVNLTNGGNIQVILDGRVMDKTRSAVEVEVPADDGGK